MSIVMMISKAEFDADPTDVNVVNDYPGANGTLYMKTTYKGRVLTTFERNGYNDSDFYAVVWTDNGPKEIEYASTRGWSYPNGAGVDALPEYRLLYDEYLKKEHDRLVELRRIAEEKNPTVGKNVIVIKGKKYLGKSGIIFWRGVNKFRTYYKNGYNRPESLSNQVVGIREDDGNKFFIGACQVEVK